MKISKHIVVFEYTGLTVGEQGFETDDFNALVKYNDLHKGKYFDVGFGRITFKSYVGVIQAGNKVITILPKADNLPERAESSRNKWQEALLYMLNNAGFIKLNPMNGASQHTRQANLLDIYLYTFLQEADQLVHAGLIKKYRRKSANQTVLKGRLLIEKQLQYNIICKERFFTDHTVYDRNNLYNGILKRSLEIIRNMCFNNRIKEHAGKLLLYFDEITSFQDKTFDWDNISPERKFLPYKYALDLARLIIQNHCPDMRSGKQHILALLFDMNLVFEKFIYRMLKKSEARFKQHDLLFLAQQRQVFWGDKMIRPDIIVTFKNGDGQKTHRIVIDTKWKVVQAGYASDQDLKQMFAYNVQFSTDHAILLYPSLGQKNVGKRKYAVSLREITFVHFCEMYFIELFNEEIFNPTEPINNFIRYLISSTRQAGH